MAATKQSPPDQSEKGGVYHQALMEVVEALAHILDHPEEFGANTQRFVSNLAIRINQVVSD